MEQGWTDNVFPLIGRDSSGFFTIGSCVLLDSGLALTAAHNVTHAIRQSVDDEWRRKFDMEGNVKLGHGLYVMGMQGKDFPVWRVLNSSTTSKYDLSLLELAPENDAGRRHVVPPIVMRLCGPAVGETVAAMGFVEQSIDEDQSPPRLNALSYCGASRVIELHELGRDATFTTPGFVCDIEFPHGSSGGAVVDTQGKLCGIVSHAVAGEPPRSYAACIWPASMLPIPGDLEGKRFRAAIREGRFSGEGVERIFFVAQEGDLSAVNDVMIDPDKLEMVQEYVDRVNRMVRR